MKKRIKSFYHAFSGLYLLFRTQPNAQIHLLAAIAAIILAFYFEFSRIEWCLVAGAIGVVLTTEALNTAIETIVDFISPGYHEQAKKIKDVSAAAVLLASVMALTIGCLLYLPRFWTILAG